MNKKWIILIVALVAIFGFNVFGLGTTIKGWVGMGSTDNADA